MKRTGVITAIFLLLSLTSSFALSEEAKVETKGVDEEKKEKEKLEAEKRKREVIRTIETRFGITIGKVVGYDDRFIADDKSIVLDKETGLMWADKDNGRDITWEDAKAYCENYRGGGFTDWRMPTLDELAGLYDTSKENRNGYHVTGLIDITGCCPWAIEIRGSEGAYLLFTCGGHGWHRRSHANFARALPVRGGQPEEPASEPAPATEPVK